MCVVMCAGESVSLGESEGEGEEVEVRRKTAAIENGGNSDEK